MTTIKKVATRQESDSKKPPFDNSKIYKNSHLNSDHQGRCNRIPSSAEIIDGYMMAAKFFSGREQYHKDASIWYLNEAELMLEKAGQETQRAAVCADNYSQYLHLAAVATLKNLGVNVHD
jgi:hypothetical protein